MLSRTRFEKIGIDFGYKRLSPPRCKNDSVPTQARKRSDIKIKIEMKLFLLSALLLVAALSGGADADGHKLKPPGGQYNVTHILVTKYLTQYVNL